jgi:hypothetical protein
MSTEIPATTEVACIEAARWRGRLLIVDPPDVASLHAILEHREGEPGETVVQHASLARTESARAALPPPRARCGSISAAGGPRWRSGSPSSPPVLASRC